MSYGTAHHNGRGRVPASTEDRYANVPNIAPGISLHAVFDGHGGPETADITYKTLPERIRRALAALAPPQQTDLSVLSKLLQTEFVEHDKDLAAQRGRLGESGSTATLALVTPTHVLVAWLGDSPAFLFNPMSPPPFQVQEIGRHEPQQEKENARIRANGGAVLNEDGVPRVDGILMVSRAFGDFSLKEPLPQTRNSPQWASMKVSCLPDIAVWARPEQGLLVIASDGFAEPPNGNGLRSGPQMAAMIAHAYMEMGFALPAAAASTIRSHVRATNAADNSSKYRGDDITITIVNVGKEATVNRIGNGTTASPAPNNLAKAIAPPPAGGGQGPKTRRARRRNRGKTGKGRANGATGQRIIILHG